MCGSYILFLPDGRLWVETSGWARGVGESEKCGNRVKEGAAGMRQGGNAGAGIGVAGVTLGGLGGRVGIRGRGARTCSFFLGAWRLRTSKAGSEQAVTLCPAVQKVRTRHTMTRRGVRLAELSHFRRSFGGRRCTVRLNFAPHCSRPPNCPRFCCWMTTVLHLRLRAAALGGTATAMRCAVAVMRCAVLLRSAANFFFLGCDIFGWRLNPSLQQSVQSSRWARLWPLPLAASSGPQIQIQPMSQSF